MAPEPSEMLNPQTFIIFGILLASSILAFGTSLGALLSFVLVFAANKLAGNKRSTPPYNGENNRSISFNQQPPKNLEDVGKALFKYLDAQEYFDKATREELKTMVQTNQTILREEKKQTFPQFARLPPEIRVMIWKEAAKFSRVITPPELWHLKNSLPCRCPLLDVNEAKHEAVRMRSEMYYSRYPEAHPDICAKSFAYINFDVDILWVDAEFALKNFMSGEPRYGELRRLAFPYKEWVDGR